MHLILVGADTLSCLRFNGRHLLIHFNLVEIKQFIPLFNKQSHAALDS